MLIEERLSSIALNDDAVEESQNTDSNGMDLEPPKAVIVTNLALEIFDDPEKRVSMINEIFYFIYLIKHKA